METKLRSSNNISSPTFVHKVLFVPTRLGWQTEKKFKKGQMVLNYNLFSLRIKNLQDFVVVWSKGERIISGIFIFMFLICANSTNRFSCHISFASASLGLYVTMFLIYLVYFLKYFNVLNTNCM